MKSEPTAYSIQNLKESGSTLWDGIRNYQARNYIREMKSGDKAYFYHSSCDEPGIVGEMKVVGECITDPLQFDKNSKYYDSKSNPKEPKWQAITVKFERQYSHMLTLKQMRAAPELSEFVLLRKGNRLSVVPVSANYWVAIQSLLSQFTG